MAAGRSKGLLPQAREPPRRASQQAVRRGGTVDPDEEEEEEEEENGKSNWSRKTPNKSTRAI